MSYKIDEIEGIGPAYREKLATAGITTTDDLLQHCGAAKGRKQMAETTGLAAGQLLKWANMADLMRISGIGRQNAEMLEAAGVDTVKELAQRNALNLAQAVTDVNAAKKLAKTTPSPDSVAKWVEQAKSLQPMITH